MLCIKKNILITCDTIYDYIFHTYSLFTRRQVAVTVTIVVNDKPHYYDEIEFNNRNKYINKLNIVNNNKYKNKSNNYNNYNNNNSSNNNNNNIINNILYYNTFYCSKLLQAALQ